MHTLDWKHAWTGRLLTTAPTRPQALKLLEPQLDSCNARLIGEVASGKLPFLNLPFRSSLTARLKALTPQLRRFRHMVVLGIGGSALGTRALQKAFFPQQDLPNHQGPWLWILDNVDADVLEAQMSTLNPEETIVVPVSKSGGTIETLAQYFFMKAWLQRALPNTWHEHMLLVTDEKKGYLREEADRHNIVSLPVPDHLGGRYSVLSAVGLVPAAFMGLPWEDFLEGAASVNAPLVNDELGKPENLRMGARELVLRAVASRLQPIDFLHVYSLMGLFRPVVRPALGGKPRQKRQGDHAAARRGRYRSALAPADVPRRPRRQGLHPAALPEPEQGPAVPGRRAGQLGMAAGQDFRGPAQRRNPRLGCGPRA